ncbi:MAG: sugar-binding domain-containing protein, partial [Bacteroidota bacterium]
MKNPSLVLRLFLLLSMLGLLASPIFGQSRIKKRINQDWRFHKGDPDAHFYETDTDDSNWKKVHLPHTLALTSLTLDDLQDEKTQLIFHRDVAWYRKSIKITKDENRKIFLEFEGAHQITDLWINGKYVGQHAVGGYTPFHFDISDHVKRGANNQISLRLDNRRNEYTPPDPGPFDYVKFSGLYRDVYLVETDPIHITFNWEALKAGVYITTPTVDPVNKNASIRIKTVVRNEYSTPKDCEVISRIVDHKGLVVLKLRQKASIPPGYDHEFDQIGSIEDNLKLWDIDDPYLYRVHSEVLIEGKSLDQVENKLGIRKFRLDPRQGFMLNEKPIELI